MNKPAHARYRFGFLLTTALGNRTRFNNLRRYAERDEEVECIWAPISHYRDPDPWHFLPSAVRTRLAVWHQAQPVLRRLSGLDAVMLHAFEPTVYLCLRSLIRAQPLLVQSMDNPPDTHSVRYSKYSRVATGSPRHRLRVAVDRWCVGRTALQLPFSRWAAEELLAAGTVDPDRVQPQPVGLDLQDWHVSALPVHERPLVLFIGDDFERKGGDLLLDVYRQQFTETARLHLVTNRPETIAVPTGVTTSRQLAPDALRALYAEAAVVVLPTTADFSPWVILEAMACGRPVISTPVGAIPEMVHDGETGFLIPVGDRVALGERLHLLLRDPALRERMGSAGRALVEREYDASICVPQILEAMKAKVDKHRSQRPSTRTHPA
jgi:glycosyltransferase involved in cell wall biosynthesis